MLNVIEIAIWTVVVTLCAVAFGLNVILARRVAQSKLGPSFAFALRETYDLEAEAVYVYLSGNPIAQTVRVSDDVYVDLDMDSQPIGVEVLNVRRWMAT